MSFYELEQSPHEVSVDVAKEEVLGVHVLDGGIDGVECGKKVPGLKYDENSVELLCELLCELLLCELLCELW